MVTGLDLAVIRGQGPGRRKRPQLAIRVRDLVAFLAVTGLPSCRPRQRSALWSTYRRSSGLVVWRMSWWTWVQIIVVCRDRCPSRSWMYGYPFLGPVGGKGVAQRVDTGVLTHPRPFECLWRRGA